MRVPTEEAYRLLHDGARALAKVEAAGLRVDEVYLENAIAKLSKKIERLQREIRESEIWREWRRKYGVTASLRSRLQLGEVLKECGVKLPEMESGRSKTDEHALSKLDLPFVKTYLELESWHKAQNTYLAGLKREVADGFIHPMFNLHTVVTYRSSSDSPNFQNFPVRDEFVSKVIRRCIIPRRGRSLVEVDYSGIEVRIAACYNRDPVLIDYIRNPSKDMHRDMAAQCYCMPDNEVTDKLRYAGKNKFVFPQFYGDWFWACAVSLWESAIAGELKGNNGRSVKSYLAKRGIDRLGSPECESGTFASHIKEVEEDFWGRRFRVYARWRKAWMREYERNGYMRLLTGFICRGSRRKNEIVNHPIQGTAFHCLLWSLNRLVLEELRRRKLHKVASVVGQIHDSLLGDVVTPSIQSYQECVEEVMTKQLPRVWSWIIVPLEVEVKRFPNSWAEEEN